jgi:hypothetical protein
MNTKHRHTTTTTTTTTTNNIAHHHNIITHLVLDLQRPELKQYIILNNGENRRKMTDENHEENQ